MSAADVLSDATSRALYDRFGAEGMRSRAGAAAGRGNARQARATASRPLHARAARQGRFLSV
jgi:DnaJ-class molecular chaperone